MKERIEKRLKENLDRDKKTSRLLTNADQEYAANDVSVSKARALQKDFELVGKNKVELQKDGDTFRIADPERFKQQIEQAKQKKREQERSRGWGRGD